MRMLLSAATLALWLPLAHAAEPAPLQRFIYERAEMGLPFRITLYAADNSAARAAADAAFARIAELNAVLSDYDSDSELSRLSRTSAQETAVPVSLDLWRVVATATVLAERTGGAFDITVGPMVNLWRRARRKLELPSTEAIAQAKQRVGWQHVRLQQEPQTIELLAREMRLDAGGIAKGYAVDEALAIPARHGQRRTRCGWRYGSPVKHRREEGWRAIVRCRSICQIAQPMSSAENRAVHSGDSLSRVELDGARTRICVDQRTGVGPTDHQHSSHLASA
jgi:thiamine biosynthesis lipoprotein